MSNLITKDIVQDFVRSNTELIAGLKDEKSQQLAHRLLEQQIELFRNYNHVLHRLTHLEQIKPGPKDVVLRSKTTELSQYTGDYS